VISSWPFRAVIVVLTVWALWMIVPDISRPFAALGSIGLSADNNGRIVAVDPDGPAARQKIVPFHNHQPGDAIDLKATPRDDLIEVFGGLGGMQYLQIGQSVTLDLLEPDGTPFPHPIKLTATIAPLSESADVVLELDQILGIGFVLLAVFIVWMYPRRSTLGFFLFAIWFNPGQYFWFYAHLTPGEMMAQEAAQAIFYAAGVVGFLEFALRFPTDKVENWRATVEKLVPVIFVVLATLGLLSFGTEFGVRSELISRIAYGAAYAVYPLVVFAFITKLRVLSPADALRLRWVIAGCIPGLFFFILVDSIESTSMWQWLWDRMNWSPPETWLNVGYMVNSLVAISIAYAVVRQRVLPIAFLLNRGLVLGIVWFILTACAELVLVITHSILEDQHLLSTVLIGLVLAFSAPFIERLQDYLNDVVDQLLFRSFHESEKHLALVAESLSSATSLDGIDQRLIDAPSDAFDIASAAVFRSSDDGSFTLAPHARGWPATCAQTLAADDPLILQLREFQSPARLSDVLRNNADLPSGANLPAIFIPLVTDRKVTAFVSYGGHHTGTDLSPDEIACLVKLAAAAAAAREHVRTVTLQQQLEALQRRLLQIATPNIGPPEAAAPA
jgi:hypothetical protein